MQLKTRPITRAQAKKFKDNLVSFTQGVIKSQEGIFIPEDSKPILSIQVVKAKMDLGNCFDAFKDSE